MSILNPSPTTAIITALIIFLTPIFLHFIVFRTRTAKNLPSFLLLGPGGAGKTALMTSVRLLSSSTSFPTPLTS